MSAYVVDREHIIYLVEAGFVLPSRHSHLHWVWDCDREAGTYKTADLRPGDYEAARRVGQMLWDENIKSVQCRYSETSRDNLPGPVGESFEFEWAPEGQPPAIMPLQTLMAIACYHYQSCEHPEWEASEAFAYIRVLKDFAISALPGYDKCRWEITTRLTPREAHRSPVGA